MTTIDRAKAVAEARWPRLPEGDPWRTATRDARYGFRLGAVWASRHERSLAEIRVQRVRDLHHPWGDTLTGTRVCNECDHAWPCATVRALDGDE